MANCHKTMNIHEMLFAEVEGKQDIDVNLKRLSGTCHYQISNSLRRFEKNTSNIIIRYQTFLFMITPVYFNWLINVQDTLLFQM